MELNIQGSSLMKMKNTKTLTCRRASNYNPQLEVDISILLKYRKPHDMLPPSSYLGVYYLSLTASHE
jgi:hypothetical protein